jgi:tetratricopeptide (TPR) repeat protein
VDRAVGIGVNQAPDPAGEGDGVLTIGDRTVLVEDHAGVDTASAVLFDLAPTVAQNRVRRLYSDGNALAVRSITDMMLVSPAVQRLRAMDGLDAGVRAAAVESARGWGDQLNYLNSGAWGDCASRANSPAAYQSALIRAEAVCEQWPAEHSFINTLGVAQYRVGQDEKAIASLLESDRLNRQNGGTTQADDAAFLAMAYHRLGNPAEAERWLKLSVASAPAGGAPPNSELAAFLEEASATLGEGGGGTAPPEPPRPDR